MERESRKRGRGGDNDEREDLGKNAKKSDFTCDDTNSKPIGVFDFPWLKEGMIFYTEEDHSEFEDAINGGGSGSYSGLEVEYSGGQFFLNFEDDDDDDDDDKFEDNLGSFQVEEFDGIWSSVLDQPLATGINKV